MLLSLRLRDFVIVDTAEFDLENGFTVFSGETGAGKSILIDALQLALGGRADAGYVREGAARADICAEFATDEAIDEWLAEHALSGDGTMLQMRRVIEADGRSRALINAMPATAALQRQIGERLVDIHGQHEAQSLLRGNGQRDRLDACAGLQDLAAATASAYASWQAAAEQLAGAESLERGAVLEREHLSWQVTELADLAMGPSEWEELNDEQRRAAHAAALIEGAQGAVALLADGENPLSSTLSQLVQRLRSLREYDTRLGAAVEMLETAAINVDEAVSELGSYADRVDLDPQRLDELERRIGAIFAAARKFRLAPEAIPTELEVLQARLAQLTAAQDLAALRSREQATRGEHRARCDELSARRRAAAADLAQAVTELLATLGMSGGRLEVLVEPVAPGPSGADRVEFRIAAHAGASPRPMAKIASGGELSRIGLAIAVLSAQANPVPTLIFDEADAGVGGAVAEVIGALMRRLGAERQVLSVTHLPQVAAQANQHFLVTKDETGGRASCTVAALERQPRVEEIARMLGGVEITATTRAHAREMLAG